MIEKKHFYIELDAGRPLDLGDLTKAQWREIERRSKHVLFMEQTKNEKIAFVAAFLNYISELQAMKVPLSETN